MAALVSRARRLSFGCTIVKKGKKSVGWTRRVPDGCVDRVRPAGGGRRLRGGRQRNERVHDRVRRGHVDDGVAEHVGPADTRLLINATDVS